MTLTTIENTICKTVIKQSGKKVPFDHKRIENAINSIHKKDAFEMKLKEEMMQDGFSTASKKGVANFLKKPHWLLRYNGGHLLL